MLNRELLELGRRRVVKTWSDSAFFIAGKEMTVRIYCSEMLYAGGCEASVGTECIDIFRKGNTFVLVDFVTWLDMISKA